MKFLKKFESDWHDPSSWDSFLAKRVEKKIQLLKDLSLDLSDIGYEIILTDGSDLPDDKYWENKILLQIMHKSTIKFSDKSIMNFEETLKSYGINYLFREKIGYMANKNRYIIYYAFSKEFDVDPELL